MHTIRCLATRVLARVYLLAALAAPPTAATTRLTDPCHIRAYELLHLSALAGEHQAYF